MFPSRAGFLALVGLSMVQAGVPRPSPPPTSPAKPLVLGQILESPLGPAEEHTYRITLSAGDFLGVKVTQRGIDAIVSVLDPVGGTLLRMDSPNSRRGEEPLLAVAGSSGTYLVKVCGTHGRWRGSYRIVAEKHPATPADRSRAAALALIAQGDDLKRQKRSDLALAQYRRALGIWSGIHDLWGQILAFERLGDLFERLDRKPEALASYEQILPLARTADDRRAEIRVSNRLTRLLRDLGQTARSWAMIQAAPDLARQAKDPAEEAYAWNNLGMALKNRGEVQEALTAYGSSQKIWQSLDEPAEHARVLCNRGALLLDVGQPEEALGAFNQALEQLRLEDKTSVRFSVLSGIGMAYYDLGSLPFSILHYRRALSLASRPSDEAWTLRHLGVVLLDQRKTEKAADFLERSLHIAQSVKDPVLEAYDRADLAHIDDLQHREEDAIRGFNRALKLLDETSLAPRASALFGRAETERHLGRLKEALASIQQSVDLTDSLRSGLSDPSLRVSFFASRYRYFEFYIDLLMEMHRCEPTAGHAVRAFETSETARARSLLDEVAGQRGAPAMALAEIQREVLDDDSILLSYALGKDRSFLWVVTPGSVAPFTLPDRSSIEEAVAAARLHLGDASFGVELKKLSKILLPAGIGPLGRQRLLIVPDGALHLVPFEALTAPGTSLALVFDHDVVSFPSASVIGRMRQKLGSRRPALEPLAILSDPVFERNDERLVRRIGEPRKGEPREELPGGHLQRLRFTHAEAKAILALVPEAASYSDFEANRDVAKSPSLARHRMLHFATHNLPEGHPDLTGLVLSRYDERGRPRDGLLRASEIYNMSLPAELAVLSACGTGLGRRFQGEGPMGLTRAFLHAGTKRVVVSLWDVGEGATAELMTRFYRSMLRDHLSPAAALRAAQVSMAKDPKWRSPKNWAGFVLQGEPR
jgi:CHAT domain-containing protein/tetratricopeptide (TPR) repeat protein